MFEFEFFGTMGSRVQEEQTKRNVSKLREHAEELLREPRPSRLWLHFQLREDRLDRDLDNLGDALMPLYNGWFPGLGEVQLSKGPRRPCEKEYMWFCAHGQS